MSRLLAVAIVSVLLPAPGFSQTDTESSNGSWSSAGRGDSRSPGAFGGRGGGSARGDRGAFGGGRLGQERPQVTDEDRRQLFQEMIRQRQAAEAVATQEAGGERTTVVLPVTNVPAAEIAKAVERVLNDRSVTIDAEPISNSLLISIAPERADLAAEAVKALDKAPKSLSVEFAIVEMEKGGDVKGPLKGSIDDVIEEWKPNGVVSVERASLTTLENQLAQVQVGATKPIPSGTSFGRGGAGGAPARIVQYRQEEVGTLVHCTGRVAGEQVVLEVSIERSKFDAPEAAPDGEVVAPERQVLTVESTIRATPGETVVVGSRGEDGKLVVVLASVRVGDKPSAAKFGPQQGAKPAPMIKVFALQNTSANEAKTVLIELIGGKNGKSLQLEADSRTNALIVRGDSESVNKIAALLSKLDEDSPERPKKSEE